jgi:hypothetical protein
VVVTVASASRSLSSAAIAADLRARFGGVNGRLHGFARRARCRRQPRRSSARSCVVATSERNDASASCTVRVAISCAAPLDVLLGRGRQRRQGFAHELFQRPRARSVRASRATSSVGAAAGGRYGRLAKAGEGATNAGATGTGLTTGAGVGTGVTWGGGSRDRNGDRLSHDGRGFVDPHRRFGRRHGTRPDSPVELREQAVEGGVVDRLGDEGAGAVFLGPRPVLRRVVPGAHHDGDRGGLRVRGDHASDLVAVHVRHHEVHEDDVRRMRLQEVERLMTGRSGVDPQPSRLEHCASA